MIAYLETGRRNHNPTYALVLCDRPCNGPEYASAQRVAVSGKREARAYCKANGIKPWNF